MAALWNRQCRPTFCPGIFPSCASLYNVDREILRYAESSVIVMTSFRVVGIVRSRRPLPQVLPVDRPDFTIVRGYCQPDRPCGSGSAASIATGYGSSRIEYSSPLGRGEAYAHQTAAGRRRWRTASVDRPTADAAGEDRRDFASTVNEREIEQAFRRHTPTPM